MINKIFYYMYSSIKVLMYQKIDLKKTIDQNFSLIIYATHLTAVFGVC